MAETNENTNQKQAAQGQFSIQRIFVRDVSFESPLAVTDRSQAQPKIDQQINTKVNKINDELYEVTLQVTVTVKLSGEEGEEDKVAFLAEVHQAGVFQVKGIPEQHLQRLLLASCPTILFPYARETIDTLAIKGAFPPISLPHINFDQLFVEQMARQQAQKEAQAASPEQIN